MVTLKLYRMKHVPTGMYYQPHKHRGSNISERGKIYSTNSNGLSGAIRTYENTAGHYAEFYVYCARDSKIHKKLKSKLVFEDCKWDESQVKALTFVYDWEKEYIEQSNN
jgi:hypothetical protein